MPARTSHHFYTVGLLGPVRRGFKTEANATACEVRTELGLTPTAPLDVRQLAEYLEIPVIPLSHLRDVAPLAADLFLNPNPPKG